MSDTFTTITFTTTTFNVEDHLVLAGISGACLAFSAATCTWAIWHLSSAGPDVRQKLFWIQLLSLSCTDLLSSLMHVFAFPVGYLLTARDDSASGITAFLDDRRFGDALNVVDFTSCFIEVQIAAGFAAACSGSARFASILRWTLPLGFVAALGLGLVGATLNTGGRSGGLFVLQPEAIDIMWSVVVLTCCFVIAIFCMYSIVKSSHVPGAIQRRGRIRGVSYMANAMVTWVPIATVGTISIASPLAKSVANYLFFLNGASNVSFYVFWMWRSRKQQERLAAGWDVDVGESFVLDTYFDVAGRHDSETLEAMRLAAEAVAMVREAEAELGNSTRAPLSRAT